MAEEKKGDLVKTEEILDNVGQKEMTPAKKGLLVDMMK